MYAPDRIYFLEEQVSHLRQLYEVERKARVAAEAQVEGLLNKLKEIRAEQESNLGKVFLCSECKKVRTDNEHPCKCGCVMYTALTLVR